MSLDQPSHKPHDRLAAALAEDLGATNALIRARIETWMKQRSQSAFGRHGYDPADFGYSGERFDADFGAYCERFSIPREG